MNDVVTETLHDAAEDVTVPTIDELRFERRVRRLRNRRRAGLAGALAAAVAVPAVATPLVLDAWSDREPESPAPAVPGLPDQLGTIAFVVDGRLHLQAPGQAGGGSTETGVRVADVIAVREDGVLALDQESRAILVPFDGTGPSRPLGGEPLQRMLSAGDGTLAWVDLADRIHLRLPGGEESGRGQLDSPDQWLYDVTDGRWLEGEGSILSLTDGRGGVLVEASGRVTGAQAGGDTVSVTVAGGTEFADISSGERTQTRPGPKAGRIGALSDDGRWFVANPNPEEDATGMVRGLWAWDASTGQAQEFPEFDDTGWVVDVAWQDGWAMVVVETVTGEGVLHTLYTCSVESLECDYRYEDETGTLALPIS